MPSTEQVPGHPSRVLGVDAFRGGWVAVVLSGGAFEDSDADTSLKTLIDRHPEALAIAVDMPIGLPSTGRRECDLQAKCRVGARRNSVFLAPPLEVLQVKPFEAATARAVELTGSGISRQAYALAPRVHEVSEIGDARVIEVHPEVSFWAIAEEMLAFSKHTWNGHWHRRQLLYSVGLEVPAGVISGSAGLARLDDVLDAAAAGWSAARYARGVAGSLPEGAQPGQRQVIWY